MHRVLTVAGIAVLAAGGLPAEEGAERAPRHGFRELAVILEERAASLAAIQAIQAELLGLARRDPRAAWLARPPMERCRLALPALWCSRLGATFRVEEDGS